MKTFRKRIYALQQTFRISQNNCLANFAFISQKASVDRKLAQMENQPIRMRPNLKIKEGIFFKTSGNLKCVNIQQIKQIMIIAYQLATHGRNLRNPATSCQYNVP